MTNLATIKRTNGIDAVIKKWYNVALNADRTFQDDDVITMAAEIRALDSLGKTDRWKKAVDTWAAAVEYNRNQWSLMQFGIFATHAA